MTRPVVGIVGYHHEVPRPFGTLPVSGAPTSYAEAVRAAGGLPVLLPLEDALALLGIVDAVVLTGGADVGADPARDRAELHVARAVVGADLPTLGVCRGLQVLAVAHGGTLRGVPGHLLPEEGHRVRTAPGSLVRRLLGAPVRTSALHQQAVDEPGPCWHATAWTGDDTVEALEPTDPSWPVLGVQWHPELVRQPFRDGTGPAIFGWLVSGAAARGRRRDGRPLVAGRR
ncbi:gamma-glutamyl-gamma-aminobutyrate hydrolase family protein [Nocardioides marmoribigeumensis]|uniref:Glutamine amidotransferase n=1 Tax=Nocardioides marmoribigeumensis TaxID=433649 RepID=A0ABU2BVH5_9ACTN|nr:gamma-glutamyl-gamma-aminobutyrate hydrolase family protein [Nocardioides marmoribigeumensis]MDR7362632.1 putative glutamine amidotransferase [Nocardioides marmoribigeumensis]